MASPLRIASTAALAGALLAGTPALGKPAELWFVTITAENLAPASGTIQTPIWLGAHDGSFDLFDAGAAMGPELERLAEDGNTAPLQTLFGADERQAVLFGAGGPLFPGDTGAVSLVLDAANPSSRFLSYASMVIPSNDAFVGNDLADAHALFDADGAPVTTSITVLGSAVRDAGTELNDEVPQNTAALAQAAPDQGVSQGGVVAFHGGFMPGGNILGAIPNGDFTGPGYGVLQLNISYQPIDVSKRSLFAVADSFQVVPTPGTNALGTAELKVRRSGDRLLLRVRLWNTQNVLGASLHRGARGENGPVVVDLGAEDARRPERGFKARLDASDLVGPLAGSPLPALLAEIERDNIYLQVTTSDVPTGELRGQLVPSD